MQPIFAMIIPLGGSGGHPDNSLPGAGWGGPVDPGYGVGGGGRPSHPIALPPPGVNIPVFPTNPIAPGGGGSGGHPDNTLPGGAHPDQGLPGDGFVLIFHPAYGWILVPAGSIGTKPDNTLPSGGSGAKPTQPIAPTPTPKA